MSTLFERLGGAPAIEAVVDKFYIRVMEDNRINHFFAGIDMKEQREHLKDFLVFAFGGSPYYKGRSLRTAHQKLVERFGLRTEHFNVVLEHLVSALQELSIADDLIQEVGKILGNTQSYVLNQ